MSDTPDLKHRIRWLVRPEKPSRERKVLQIQDIWGDWLDIPVVTEDVEE